MFRLVRLFVESFARLLYSRRDLMLENLVLRQQLAVFKSRNRRPRLATVDKLFWVLTQRVWAGWKKRTDCGHPRNRSPLASCRLSPVLGMALPSQSSTREESGSASKYATSSSKCWPRTPRGALPASTVN